MKVKNGKIVKGEINKTYLILIIFIVIIFIFNLVLYLKKVAKPAQDFEIKSQKSQNYIKNETKEKEKKQKEIPTNEDEVKKYLSTLGEGDRMTYYCGQFINCIDNQEYEKAYNMLYAEFKQNYFPTLQEFENYVKNYYPRFFGVKYDDIERYKDTYVIRLKIQDFQAAEGSEEKIQRIVVREYEYNNYVISFSVNNTQNNESAQPATSDTPNVIIN